MSESDSSCRCLAHPSWPSSQLQILSCLPKDTSTSIHMFNNHCFSVFSVLGARDCAGTCWSLCRKRFMPVDAPGYGRQIKETQILATKEAGHGREQMAALLGRLFGLGGSK